MRASTLLSLLSITLPFTFARRWNTSDPCPTTIKTRISHDRCSNDFDNLRCPDDEIQFTNMSNVHLALTHCPNITELDLWVGLGGCSSWPDRENFPFNVSGGENYPPLRSLKLGGYNFERHEGVNLLEEAKKTQALREWIGKLLWRDKIAENKMQGEHTEDQLPLGGQRAKTNFEYWLDAMDWSKLEELSLTGTRLTDIMVKELPGRLTSLRKLQVANGPFTRALNNNTLTHLTWVDDAEDDELASILAHQGQSLEYLEFRCEEIYCPTFPTMFNITDLPSTAPNLKHVAINVPRNGSWPIEALESMASLPQLQSADIYMNIQAPCAAQRTYPESYGHVDWMQYNEDNNCQREDQFQRPFFNVSSGLELYKIMRSAKIGDELRKVTFWVGDFVEPWRGPLYNTYWVQGKSFKVECEREGKLEGEAWCETEGNTAYWKYGGKYGEYWSNDGYDDY